MEKIVRLKKGLTIRLVGEAEPILETGVAADRVALKPIDFPDLTPRLAVVMDQEVRAGETLFYDKYNPEICFVSPVGGVVSGINRGERRRILEVVVTRDDSKGTVDFGKADPLAMEAGLVKERLLKSGMWPFLKRRPYGILAKPSEIPKSIFISCFDTSPLAPDYRFILGGQESFFQTGIDVLTRLTPGKVHLGLPAGSDHPCSRMQQVEITWYGGPHPAGNVGVQIHHTDPVNKGDVVWTVQPQEVVSIGRFFETGKVDFSRIVALAGSEVLRPRYFTTILGANLTPFLRENLAECSGTTNIDGNKLKNKSEISNPKSEISQLRIISGNVLTGRKVQSDGYLGFYDSLVSVIPEGKYFEFLGWARPRTGQFSMSHAYFSWLMPRRKYRPDTNLHGEKRAYVMTGQYEKVLPMDILPVQLIKAILADDIEKMENLGILEVIEEDLALCEFVCTSKTEVQDILRKGINLMIHEMG